ncbi:uncharacterized protein [Aegilops tauschii subsp. strangulata]
MDCNLKIMFWNVRGLNSDAKRSAVRSVISTASPSIVCLQETKLAHISDPLVLDTLGPQFEDFYFLPATGTRGVILLAWRRSEASISNPLIGENHITALVTPPNSMNHWWLTGVYGPQDDNAKLDLLADLQDVRASRIGPWLLGGDFNMITSTEDKNNSNLNHRVMSRFRRFIADEELRDMYLHGRRYTWSSERDSPTLVRNDRVLCTSGFQDAVHEGWNALPPDPDPFRRLVSRLKNTGRHLQRWSARTIGNVSLQLMVAREIIPRLDAAQDLRPLSSGEAWLRRRLKASYLGLASLERTIARQRVRLAWLRSDDASVPALKVHASHRKQRTYMASVQVGDRVISDHEGMAKAAYDHFTTILGTDTRREFTLDLTSFHVNSFDLLDLEAPFSEDEIW